VGGAITSGALNSTDPFLGSLFRRKEKTSHKSELVILVRPVVVESDTWQEQISDFAQFGAAM